MSTEPNNPDSKDPGISARMLLAFALTGLVIFGTPYFYKAIGIKTPEKSEPKQQTTSAPASSPKPEPATQDATVSSSPSNAGDKAAAGAIAASSEEEVTVDTAVYHVVFLNRGAVVKSWTLKKYPDHSGKPLDVVNSAAVPKAGYPLSYEFRGAKPPADLNHALFKATKSEDGLSVSFEYANGGVTATKSFQFQRDSYLVQLNSTASIPHLLVWRGGFGDMAAPGESGQVSEVYYDAATGKVEREKAKAAKNGPVNRDGTFGWVGLEDQYFAAVFLPSGNATLQTTIYDDEVKTPYNGVDEPFIGVAGGGEAGNRFNLFVGPKEIDTLRKVDPKLESIVDFGWFWFIAKPLFQALHWMNDNWFHNYGWSIIVATIIINMFLFPLKLANLKSMRKMQALQPEIARINEKYKNLSLRDPKQAEKNAEMMELYQKAGTNPMSGCIPMLIQMPFLFAFYKVLTVSIALRGASWLWIGDLSQREQLPIHILAVLLIITGFIMQKMTPMTTVDPNQQRMMMFMPLMMGFIFWQAQSGLVLYWLTGNLVGIAQQWLLNKAMPAPAPPPPGIKDGKKSYRK